MLASILLATAVGWVLADVADRHVFRWMESCFLGTFVGWMIGYVVTERVLFVPAMYPEGSLMVSIEVGFRNYFFTEPLIAFAVLAGIGFARMHGIGGESRPITTHRPMAAGALLGFSLLTAAFLERLRLLNPQFPWNPDQFGLVQTVMTAIIPMITLLLIFTLAWKLSYFLHVFDNARSWLVLVVIGSVSGGFLASVGWILAVEQVAMPFREVLFTVFYGLPVTIVILSGLVCGHHGFSETERRHLKEFFSDYSAEEPS